MYKDRDIKGVDQFQRSAWLSPIGGTATPTGRVNLLTVENFGRACKVCLTHFANYSNDDLSWADVKWEIVLDGQPAREFGSFMDAIGSVSELRQFARGLIQANAKLEINAVHTNASGLGNTYKVGIVAAVDYVANS